MSAAQRAEDRRAAQMGGARAVERLASLPGLPPVRRWEIDGSTGAVRGQLDVAASREAVVPLLRPLVAAHSGRARVRNLPDGSRQLGVRFEWRLWDVELWATIQGPRGS
ncbi:hypothetical protein ABZX56_30515 [Streptomyces parvulus]|uniref:hypothetical protein n=1 Tax=Streptomyces parvulus TaxID=146923 RepID=UPI0033A41FDF